MQCEEVKGFMHVKAFLRRTGLQHHTYKIKEDEATVVIAGLPKLMDIDEIKKDLKDEHKIFQLNEENARAKRSHTVLPGKGEK